MQLAENKIDIAKKVESNFLHSFAEPSHDPNAQFWDDQESAGFITGYPDAYLNIIFKFNATTGNEKSRMTEILNRIRTKGASGWWFVGATTEEPDTVKDNLTSLGLKKDIRGYCAMLLDRKKFISTTKSAKTNHKKVEDKHGLNDFMQVFQSVFGLGDEAASFYAGFYNSTLGQHAKQSLFVLYLNNKPISISGYYIDSGVIMIHSVATLPEQRCKGYGKIASEISILEALKQSDLPVALYGSQMGENLYRQIGFEDLYVMEKYLI